MHGCIIYESQPVIVAIVGAGGSVAFFGDFSYGATPAEVAQVNILSDVPWVVLGVLIPGNWRARCALTGVSFLAIGALAFCLGTG
jgi:hypothetical protein